VLLPRLEFGVRNFRRSHLKGITSSVRYSVSKVSATFHQLALQHGSVSQGTCRRENIQNLLSSYTSRPEVTLPYQCHQTGCIQTCGAEPGLKPWLYEIKLSKYCTWGDTGNTRRVSVPWTSGRHHPVGTHWDVYGRDGSNPVVVSIKMPYKTFRNYYSDRTWERAAVRLARKKSSIFKKNLPCLARGYKSGPLLYCRHETPKGTL